MAAASAAPSEFILTFAPAILEWTPVHSQTVARTIKRSDRLTTSPRIDPLQPEGDGRAHADPLQHFAGGEVGRIAALSDGIFAIAATMLVLDFHTPEPADIHSEAELLRALAASAPKAPAMAPEPV